VKLSGNNISVKGPKGQLSFDVHPSMSVKQEGDQLIVVPNEDKPNFYGLTRSLVNNMVVGVGQGFTKSLTLVGVGYRAAVQGKDLNLTIGYSHPVIYKIPEDLNISVEKQTTVVISGADKEKVGQVAAEIRSFRRPEPYHGKGIRYSDEVIITKVGKAGAKK